jgi:hypothetical protein
MVGSTIIGWKAFPTKRLREILKKYKPSGEVAPPAAALRRVIPERCGVPQQLARHREPAEITLERAERR